MLWDVTFDPSRGPPSVKEMEVPSVRVANRTDLAGALDRLGLSGSRPTLVLVGGASGLRDDARLESLARQTLVPAIEAVGGCVVDGGTDAGVMHLMGCAHAAAGANFPLVGVVAEDTMAGSGAAHEGVTKAQPEPHHTHFIFVPGSSWGDEAPWIARTATALSGAEPSVTLVIGGGTVSYRDVTESLAAQRHVVAVSGTGGTADALTLALRRSAADEPAFALVSSGLVAAAPLSDPRAVAASLRAALAGEI
jgi:SLOG in TRPM, prokaryote